MNSWSNQDRTRGVYVCVCACGGVCSGSVTSPPRASFIHAVRLALSILTFKPERTDTKDHLGIIAPFRLQVDYITRA